GCLPRRPALWPASLLVLDPGPGRKHLLARLQRVRQGSPPGLWQRGAADRSGLRPAPSQARRSHCGRLPGRVPPPGGKLV
ncbi:hypothetical protein RI367_008834, partial [Sorochytrium milnesiophthora]